LAFAFFSFPPFQLFFGNNNQNPEAPPPSHLCQRQVVQDKKVGKKQKKNRNDIIHIKRQNTTAFDRGEDAFPTPPRPTHLVHCALRLLPRLFCG
jgi:hypothetical protein